MNNRGQQINRPPVQRKPETNMRPQMSPAQQAQLKQQMMLQQQQQQQQQQQSYPSQVTVPQAVTVLIARLNNLEQKINKIADNQHNSLSESITTDNFFDESKLLPIFERLQTIESNMSNDSLETKMNQFASKIQKLEKDLVDSKNLIMKIQGVTMETTSQTASLFLKTKAVEDEIIKLQGVTMETTSQVSSLFLKTKEVEDEIMKTNLKQNVLSVVSNNNLILNIEEQNNVSPDMNQ